MIVSPKIPNPISGVFLCSPLLSPEWESSYHIKEFPREQGGETQQISHICQIKNLLGLYDQGYKHQWLVRQVVTVKLAVPFG